MIGDQAESLRKLMSMSKKKQDKENIKSKKNHEMRIITVASGKGGVGKTSIVSNLAISLQKSGKNVLILDADLGMANVDIMFGMIPRYSLFDVIRGNKKLRDIVTTSSEGVRIIPGGSGINELVNLSSSEREIIIEELKEFSKEIDFLLIDCGAGVTKNILGFISAADEVLIVVTPEPTSITDAYALIKILAKFDLHKEVSMIVSRATSSKEAKDTISRIENVAHKFLEIDIKEIGFISNDLTVTNSIKEQKPFVVSYPKCKASKDMSLVTQKFLQIDKPQNKKTGSFFERLFNILK